MPKLTINDLDVENKLYNGVLHKIFTIPLISKKTWDLIQVTSKILENCWEEGILHTNKYHLPGKINLISNQFLKKIKKPFNCIENVLVNKTSNNCKSIKTITSYDIWEKVADVTESFIFSTTKIKNVNLICNHTKVDLMILHLEENCRLETDSGVYETGQHLKTKLSMHYFVPVMPITEDLIVEKIVQNMPLM